MANPVKKPPPACSWTRDTPPEVIVEFFKDRGITPVPVPPYKPTDPPCSCGHSAAVHSIYIFEKTPYQQYVGGDAGQCMTQGCNCPCYRDWRLNGYTDAATEMAKLHADTVKRQEMLRPKPIEEKPHASPAKAAPAVEPEPAGDEAAGPVRRSAPPPASGVPLRRPRA